MSRSISTSDFVRSAEEALALAGLSVCSGDEVSVVLFDSTSWCDLQDDALGLLGDDERRRAVRFRFAHDRSAYVLAHAMCRVVLGRCLGVQPEQVPLHFLPTGQPHLPGTGLCTSLSRSGPMVLIAVGAGGVIGADLERCPPRMPMAPLLSAICSPEECMALSAMSPGQRERALLQVWTRKEALLKAWGTGLQQAPASFRASVGDVVAPPQGVDGLPCRVVDLALPQGHVGALAVAPHVMQHRLHAIAPAVSLSTQKIDAQAVRTEIQCA